MKDDEIIMKKFIKLNLNNIPPNSNHKITAGGETNSEFYFVRVK